MPIIDNILIIPYGPKWYRPIWLWAEIDMGRNCYGPKCPVTDGVDRIVDNNSYCLQTLEGFASAIDLSTRVASQLGLVKSAWCIFRAFNDIYI